MIIFTICSFNYLPQAVLWFSSLRKSDLQSKAVIFICDVPRDLPGFVDLPKVLFAEEIDIDQFSTMAFQYTPIELNTAIKPFCFRFLTECYPEADWIVYMDPDTQLYGPLRELSEQPAADADLVLTPHIQSPLDDGGVPEEITILRSGIYNLGFCAIRPTTITRRLIDWWCGRLQRHCRVDVARGLFTDQRWMDLAPSFVPKTCLLQHPGYNAAYWNIHDRSIAECDGRWLINDAPLRFLHFSGIDAANRATLSRYQDRRFPIGLDGGARLFFTYHRELSTLKEELQANTQIDLTYGYGRFSDGRKIFPSQRRYYWEYGWLIGPGDGSAFDQSDWFDQADPRCAGKALASLTRTAIGAYLLNHKPKSIGELCDQSSCETFAQWFANHAVALEIADEIAVQRQKDLISEYRKARDRSGKAEGYTPSSSAYSIEVQPALQFDQVVFDDPFGPPLSNLMLGLWQSHPFLQERFPDPLMVDRLPYAYWCITEGLEGAYIVAHSLAEPVYEYFFEHLFDGKQRRSPLLRLMALKHFLQGIPGQEAAHWVEGNGAEVNREAVNLLHQSVDLGWPAHHLQPIIDWLSLPDRRFGDMGISIPNVLGLLWEVRADLQAHYQLDTVASKFGLFGWFIFHGLDETPLRQYFSQFRDVSSWDGPLDEYPAISRAEMAAICVNSKMSTALDYLDQEKMAQIPRLSRLLKLNKRTPFQTPASSRRDKS